MEPSVSFDGNMDASETHNEILKTYEALLRRNIHRTLDTIIKAQFINLKAELCSLEGGESTSHSEHSGEQDPTQTDTPEEAGKSHKKKQRERLSTCKKGAGICKTCDNTMELLNYGFCASCRIPNKKRRETNGKKN